MSASAADVGVIKAQGLAALRRRQSQVLLGSALLASALMLALLGMLLATAAQDYHQEREQSLDQVSAEVEQVMAQRSHGYARSAALTQVLWAQRAEQLESWGSAWQPQTSSAQVVSLSAPAGVRWQVLTGANASVVTTRLLGLVYEASYSARATAAERLAPGSLQAIVRVPDQDFWAATGAVLPTEGQGARDNLAGLMTTAEQTAPAGAWASPSPQSWLMQVPGQNVMKLAGRFTVALPGAGNMTVLELEDADALLKRARAGTEYPVVLVSSAGHVLGGRIEAVPTADLAAALQASQRQAGHIQHVRAGQGWLRVNWVPQAHAAVASYYTWADLAQAVGPSLAPIIAALMLLLVGMWLGAWRLHAAVLQPAWRAAQGAYDAERLFRRVIETSPDPQALLDPRTGRLLFASASYEAVIAPRMAASDLISAARAGGGEQAPILHLSLANPAGPDNEYEVQASLVRYQEAEYMLVALHDVSARVQLEQHLREAQHQAQAHSRAKTAFVAHMSHEIRTPLNGLMGHLELLARSALSAEQKDRVSRMRSSADGLLALLGDALDLTKVEAQLLELRSEPFDLVALTESVIRTHAAAAETKGLTLDSFIDPAVVGMWRADPHRLRQVLNNLLGNAIKFTDSGFVQVFVERRQDQAGAERVCFDVVDSGCGIPEDQWGRVLQPYAQVRADDAGTGLGLALADELVRLAGGTLQLYRPENGRGQGFRFVWDMERLAAAPSPLSTVTVAVACETPAIATEWLRWLHSWGMQAHTVAMEDIATVQPTVQWCLVPCQDEWDEEAQLAVPERWVVLHSDGPARPLLSGWWKASAHAREQVRALLSNEQGQVSLEPEPPTLCALHFLVVDDHVVNRQLLKEQLGALGHTCDCVADGLQALEQWQTKHYDGLLTDLSMPKMDGPALVARIRAEASTAPVLAITASAWTIEHQRALDAGISQVLIKPYSIAELAQALARLFPDAVSRAVPRAPVISSGLLEAFSQASEADQVLLRDALEQGNRAEIGLLCHRIKGALRMIGQVSAAQAFDAFGQAAEHAQDSELVRVGEHALSMLSAVLEHPQPRTHSPVQE